MTDKKTQTTKKLKLAQIYSLAGNAGFGWKITWWEGDQVGETETGEEQTADDCAFIVRHIIQENEEANV